MVIPAALVSWWMLSWLCGRLCSTRGVSGSCGPGLYTTLAWTPKIPGSCETLARQPIVLHTCGVQLWAGPIRCDVKG